MTYRKSYSRSGSYRSYKPRRSSSSYSSYRPRRSYSSYSSYRPKRSSSYSNRSSGLSTRTKNGYSQYYDRRSDSWKFTHRRVAEKKLGGRIRSGYEVHHINHNKRDNRSSNLRVLSRSAHRAIHRRSKPRRSFFRWWKK